MFDQKMVEEQPRRLRGSIGNDNQITIIDDDNNDRHHRRLDEDVDYWRKRAGWADDDETMKKYNQGVYNTYYSGGDGSTINAHGGKSSSKKAVMDHMGWILGLSSTIIFLLLLLKCCSSAPKTKGSRSRTSSVKSNRDSSRSIRDKHSDRRRSRSRSRAASGRSRSKSRTRSKSKSLV